jgi:hypothetical protein
MWIIEKYIWDIEFVMACPLKPILGVLWVNFFVMAKVVNI